MGSALWEVVLKVMGSMQGGPSSEPQSGCTAWKDYTSLRGVCVRACVYVCGGGWAGPDCAAWWRGEELPIKDF